MTSIPTDNSSATASYNVFTELLLRWTPRTIVATGAGYYSLGFAYEKGIMAAIDKIAIKILVKQVGYIGLGAAMPLFQWYAAWGLRITVALVATLLYNLCEKIFLAIYPHICCKQSIREIASNVGNIV